MATLVDVPELLEILRLTPPSQNILLVGRHGIGKSEILTSWFEETRELRVVSFFLGQMSDPGDLIGLPRADSATGRSVFLPPFWWPEGDQPIVLFLDELNRARPELLQAIQDLTLNRTLAGRRLPDGSVVVALDGPRAVPVGEAHHEDRVLCQLYTELDPLVLADGRELEAILGSDLLDPRDQRELLNLPHLLALLFTRRAALPGDLEIVHEGHERFQRWHEETMGFVYFLR